ncbi:MAG TPA: HDOD domain-containing protein [Gammaproteobacteria bacterium]|nr:HDOD domain-containing protein [Gammaproteobacteria bacterium]
MVMKAKEVAKKVKNLATLPDVCLKINRMADDPNASIQDLKTIIETDAALSAKLLKIANSSFYGYATKIDDLNRAIMLIGTQGLRDLVWTMSSISSFSQLSNDLVDMRTFWEHSLYTATVARVLAKKCNVLNQDRLFLCGLLHDVGHLALYQYMPEEMEAVFNRVRKTRERLILVEKSELGFTHPVVSYALLKMWKLPESICQAVAYHHQPMKCEAYRLDAAIVYLADNIAKLAGKKGNMLERQSRIDPNVWKITGLSDKIIEPIIQISNDQFKDAISLYLGALYTKTAA